MLTRRLFTVGLIAGPAGLMLSRPAMAAEPEIFQEAGIAIRGTDPLGYFDSAMPVAGSPDHATMWRGATWHFGSAEAQQRFEMSPETYVPEFGGYCAYAASLGYLAPTTPEAWTIHEGMLYLNASLRARELWLQDIEGNIAKGRANWPAILG